MTDHTDDQTSGAEPPAPPSAAAERAERIRERLRQGQAVAAQRARSEAAGGMPSDADVARMVADFHARGGQVTVCPPSDDAQPAKPPRDVG